MKAQRHSLETLLTLEGAGVQADTDEGQAACDKLCVDVLPTVQFWRSKKKLWEHRGILHLEQDLGEGKAPSGSVLRILFRVQRQEEAVGARASCSWSRTWAKAQP